VEVEAVVVLEEVAEEEMEVAEVEEEEQVEEAKEEERVEIWPQLAAQHR
jgi:hypothetical protein